MAYQVHLAYRGKPVDISLESCSTVQHLKESLSKHLPQDKQILMTSEGKNVKQQHLRPGVIIYAYDKRHLDTTSNPADDFELRSDGAHNGLSALRDESSDPHQLVDWQRFFRRRQEWVEESISYISTTCNEIDSLLEASAITQRGTQVAIDNLSTHVRALKSKFEEADIWAKETVQEHEKILRQTSQAQEAYENVQVRSDVISLLRDARCDQVGGKFMSLSSTIDEALYKGAFVRLKAHHTRFTSSHQELLVDIEKVDRSSFSLSRITVPDLPQADISGVRQEAEALMQKVRADCQDVYNAQDSPRTTSRLGRLAETHSNEILPAVQELVLESSAARDAVADYRLDIATYHVNTLREVSRFQSDLVHVQQKVLALAVSQDALECLDHLDLYLKLPQVYGSVLIEAVRRTEWQYRVDVEWKTYRRDLHISEEEELKRRSKWANTIGDLLAPAAFGTDKILKSDDDVKQPLWANVRRDDVFLYIDHLGKAGLDDSVKQTMHAMRDLDRPTRSLYASPKAQMSSSIQTLARSTQVTDGDAKTLFEDKIRLEDKLKASQSRISKLEIQLQIQSQSRGTPTSIFAVGAENDQEPALSAGSGRPWEPPSRKSSLSTRRLSNQNPEEKALGQKILSLEAQVEKLQQQAHTERKSTSEHRERMMEAESVKRDLMANFEAHKQEFEDDRQRLQNENHEMRIKIEELEEELDRILGSKDYERSKQEEAVVHFRNELERLRKNGNEELDSVQAAKEALEQDLVMQRERHAHLEQQLQEHKYTSATLQARHTAVSRSLRELDSQQKETLSSLQALHGILSPTGTVPDDLKKLLNVVGLLAEDATSRIRGLDNDLHMSTAQGKVKDERLKHLERQIEQCRLTETNHVASVAQKEAQLLEAQQTLQDLRDELANERQEIGKLREQFAAGEGGTDVLRKQLAEAESKYLSVQESRHDLDQSLRQAQHLARNTEAQLKDMTISKEKLLLGSRSRAKKAQELSGQLYQHNDRIIRLLENFGYAITKQENGLLIQRASRANASTILSSNEGPELMQRAVSGTKPITHYTDNQDTRALYWTDTDAEDQTREEEQYQTFVSTLSRLDHDSMVELLTKRYKDVESLAKKYQKDSRIYREKTARLQSDAHDKIAYRGFKEGDLALFLPTRNQATKPWAAFNVGAPHYFLRETDSHRLQSRDWLLARVNRVEERVVDLSRSMRGLKGSLDAVNESDNASVKTEDENPFELSDGLRWYMIDATEEKPGAPSTPGLGKSTVAASVVEVKAHMGRKLTSSQHGNTGLGITGGDATKTLQKSLESRRSSNASRKSAGQLPVLRKQTSQGTAATALTTTDTDTTIESTRSLAQQHVQPDQRHASRTDGQIFDAARRPYGYRKDSRSGQEVAASRTRSPSKAQQSQNEQGKWDKLFSFQFQA